MNHIFGYYWKCLICGIMVHEFTKQDNFEGFCSICEGKNE